jgi:hypothetical protein
MLSELLLRLRGQEGQDVLEFALVFSLVVVVGLVGVVLLGQNVSATSAGNATALPAVVVP